MQYGHILHKATSRKKQVKKLLAKLQSLPSKKTDELFHEEHEQVFEQIDCLKCANCCKGTGPLFTQKDIERIAGHLRVKPGNFIQQYLRIDEDQDYVLQSTPCNFLDEANYCKIYEVRPKACREFPHTDRRNMQEISNLTYKNAMICPAVYTILEQIETKLQKNT